MLGLLLLVGCVACESDEYVSPPPYVEEIEAFDWSVVDAEALEGRLTSDVWEMVEYWSGNGGNGWIPLSTLDMISHRRNWVTSFLRMVPAGIASNPGVWR